MSRLVPGKFLELRQNAMKISRSAQPSHLTSQLTSHLTQLPAGKAAANRLAAPFPRPVFGFFIPRRIPLFTGLIVLYFSSVIYAVEESSSDQTTANPIQDAPPKQTTPGEKLAEEPQAEKSNKEEPTEKVEEISADNPLPSDSKTESDKMDRAAKGMRSAGDKLDGGITAEETQAIQKQVIKDLDEIINQLENPPPKQGGGGGGGGGSGGGGSGGGGGSSGRSQRRGNREGSSLRKRSSGPGRGQGSARSQAEPKPGEDQEQAGGAASENGSDSSKQSQQDRKEAEEAARRRKLEMDVWGHLPPHVREELLNTYGERMLPKYEHLVKRFYEALSTQSDSKTKFPAETRLKAKN